MKLSAIIIIKRILMSQKFHTKLPVNHIGPRHDLVCKVDYNEAIRTDGSAVNSADHEANQKQYPSHIGKRILLPS